MSRPATLSDTGRAMLTVASESSGHLTRPPEWLPLAAQRSKIRSLLKSGLMEEVTANNDQTAWRTSANGTQFSLRATEAGLQAVGSGPTPTGDAPLAPADIDAPPLDSDGQSPTTLLALPKMRVALRKAAEEVLSAWDDPVRGRSADGDPALAAAMVALRAALTKPARRQPTRPDQPRPDTKRATILALLRRPEGATVTQLVDVTGWARHTVHGFFAGLKKAGTQVEVLERIRRVGPGKQGAAGSYTIYRVAEAG